MKLRLVLACSSAVAGLGLCATAAPVLAAPARSVPLNVTVPCGTTGTTELIQAINDANANPDGGTIRLAERCTYAFSTNIGQNALPVIDRPITIKGEDSTLIRSDTSPDFRLLEVSSTGQLTLKNLTVANGHANGDGGAVLNRGILRVEKSTLAGNRANDDGGAVYNDGGNVKLSDSYVQTNYASDDGGGLANSENGSLTLLKTVVAGNQADDDGGGIHNEGRLVVNSSHIENNSAREGNGGGLYTEGQSTIKETKFVENWAGESGGGINQEPDGVLEVFGSEFYHNKAGADGGALHNAGDATLNKTKIFKNQAGDDGGGINNEVETGGDTPVLTLKHVVIKENRAADQGGGVRNETGGIVENVKSEIVKNLPTNCAGDVPGCYTKDEEKTRTP
ncbi:hypothetical protein [Streptomyces sp. NPDC012888]|uniref:hypothetical protein n=1 Tax=Streptomyces sp. NPDC012888 TaxID=3364855 RepID=UPI0036A93CC2